MNFANFKLFVYLTTLSFVSLEEVKPLTTNPNSISYHVEFEVLSYENPEGRLASGECCSGYKSTLGHGICRGGSSSCNPYWKICMSHQQDPQRTLPLDFSMPVERRSGPGLSLGFHGLSAFRTEPKPVIKRPKPPQTRQSLFKGIFNRIVGSFKGLSSSPSNTSSSSTLIALHQQDNFTFINISMYNSLLVN
uniref:Notch ligand N-terminal domain-containing protein n=1 Tax=Tetranychus urticae TaxID=32264 RepID=T1KR57_TETUR